MKENKDLPAMPVEVSQEQFEFQSTQYFGLSKREAFAMHALQGVLANPTIVELAEATQEKLGLNSPCDVYVGFALEATDAILQALEDKK